MHTSDFRFDPFISNIGADKLKKMVSTYGGNAKMRKQECIDYLLAALNNPIKVRQVVANLAPFEQFSLALAKEMGGAIEYHALGIALLAAGVDLPKRLLRSEALSTIAGDLVSQGLFLSDGYSLGEFHPGYGRHVYLYADSRLLVHVGALNVAPAKLAAVETHPKTTTLRMPPTVVLEIIALLQAVDTIGGLGRTKQGELRVNDIRKLQKALQWPDDLPMNGLVFHDAFHALVHALCHSDYLQIDDNTHVLKRPLERVASESYAEQVSILLNGFLRLTEWTEMPGQYPSYYHENYRQGRAALIMSLRSLPIASDDFYAIDEFDRLLYDRISNFFSLKWLTNRYIHTYGKSEAEIRRLEQEREEKQRQQWLANERPWIEMVFGSWLYFLGLVELALDGKRITAFRLTDLGKAVLHPAAKIEVASTVVATDDNTGAWVVQPNFDIMVYLDRTTPLQLAFLERHAERTQAQQYMAHYQLTRDSVYRGIESGTTLEELLAQLQEHAQAPLPQNVTVEIREWAALREQVILHHRAELLEFANEATRDAALATKLVGTAVGERFLLLAPAEAERKRLPNALGALETLDYTEPLPQVLRADEAGLLQLQSEPTDLLLTAMLDQWAVRDEKGHWQLTPAQVATQLKAGARIDDLLGLLEMRLKHKTPPLLEVTLRNWARRRPITVELERFTVLRCDDNLMHAIATSKRLKPYLRGIWHQSNLVLFDPLHWEEVQEILGWTGVELSAMRL